MGALTLDYDAHQIRRGDELLLLTPREFDVLAFLMTHSGRVVTHHTLLSSLWGPGYGAETQYLRVFINRLRHKIEDDPAHPHYILTEPGVGYRLVAPA